MEISHSLLHLRQIVARAERVQRCHDRDGPPVRELGVWKGPKGLIENLLGPALCRQVTVRAAPGALSTISTIARVRGHGLRQALNNERVCAQCFLSGLRNRPLISEAARKQKEFSDFVRTMTRPESHALLDVKYFRLF
eukprot:gene20607-biopygen6830